MLGLIKKVLIVVLSSIVNASNNTKCVSSRNINLHPNKQSSISLLSISLKFDGCVGSSNTINDLSNKVCIPNKTEDLNLSVFNIITGKNESRTLIKNISCECKCKSDVTKCNLNQWWNNDKCWCECKTFMYVKEIVFGILLHVVVKMENI